MVRIPKLNAVYMYLSELYMPAQKCVTVESIGRALLMLNQLQKSDTRSSSVKKRTKTNLVLHCWYTISLISVIGCKTVLISFIIICLMVVFSQITFRALETSHGGKTVEVLYEELQYIVDPVKRHSDSFIFSPLTMKWTLPSLQLDTSIAAVRGFSQNTIAE